MASRMVIPDIGKVTFANLLVSKYVISADPMMKIGLYQNNYTPISSSVFTDFTDATFSGYAIHNITNPALWLLASLVGGKGRVAYSINQQWLQSAITVMNTIYGYYVWLSGASITPTAQLLCAERFTTPIAFNVVGQTLNLTPQFEVDLDP